MFYSKQNLTRVLFKDVHTSLALLEMCLLLPFRVSVAFSMPMLQWNTKSLCPWRFPAEFCLLLPPLLLLWPCSSRIFSSCCVIFWTFSTLMITWWLQCIFMIRHLCFTNKSLMKIIPISLKTCSLGALNNFLSIQFSFSSSNTTYALQVLYKSQTSPYRRYKFIHSSSSGILFRSRHPHFPSLSS